MAALVNLFWSTRPKRLMSSAVRRPLRSRVFGRRANGLIMEYQKRWAAVRVNAGQPDKQIQGRPQVFEPTPTKQAIKDQKMQLRQGLNLPTLLALLLSL